MSQMKNKIVPLFIIFINMVIMGMVMESAYYIQGFRHMELWVFAILPLLTVLGSLGLMKGENRYYKLGFLFLGLLSAYLLFHQVKTIDLLAIPTDVGVINSTIMEGLDIQFDDFANILKLMMLVGATMLSVTLYIFPYNMVILDMGLLLFLWIVDYYRNSYEYVRFFIPVWAFSIFFYRTTLLDQSTKSFKVHRKRRLTEAMILTLVVTLGSFFIDVEAKGIYSDRLWNYFNGQVVPPSGINGRNIGDPFGIGLTGYNDSDTILGGDIAIDNTEVLHVFGEEAIYLRGAVKSTYLGDRWQRDYREYDPVSQVPEEKMAFYEEIVGTESARVLEIRPVVEMTSNLFNGVFTKEMMFHNHLALLYYNAQDNVFTSSKTVINNYYLTYYPEEEILGALFNRVRNDPQGFSGPYGEPYAEYLQVGETITERTVELVNSLVADAPTSVAKAYVLGMYLMENYEYTLTPGDLPEGADFVDHFLFEVQEGYCVYFGTALTMMLRIAGVPARYVEGFKMFDELEDGKYIVKNSDAHAWTEILVDPENDIWVTVDATGTPRELLETEEPEGETPEDEEGAVDPLNPENDPSIQEPDQDGGFNGPGIETEEERTERIRRNIVLSSLGAMVLFMGLWMSYRKLRIKYLMKEGKLLRYYKEIIRGLSLVYYRKEPGETPLEMARRIKDDELRALVEELIMAVYQEKFSGEPGIFTKRQELYDDVYGLAKEYRGDIYIFFKKYIG